jgi:hypothetical protein
MDFTGSSGCRRVTTTPDTTRPDNGRLRQTWKRSLPRPATVTDKVNVLCKQMITGVATSRLSA